MSSLPAPAVCGESAVVSPWTRFWFCDPAAPLVLPWIRLVLSLLAAAYFLSFWSDAGRWFAGDGWLSAVQVATFLSEADLAEQVRWRLSPLYWLDSAIGLRIYLVMGVIWAVLAASVSSTRLPTVALWLWVVWWANRALLISGLEELALVWSLGCLALAPPQPAGWWRGLRQAATPHWSGSLAKRLLQAHVTLVIAATGLSMLASRGWWDGTAAMAMAAPKEIRTIDWTGVLRAPAVHESATHAIVLLAIALPLLLWHPVCRRWAVPLGWLWCVGLAALSSQWLYFFCLASVLATFLPEKSLLAWNRRAAVVKVDHD